MNNIFTKSKFSDPVFLRNLKIYPVRMDSPNGFLLTTVEEMIAKGNAEFRELDDPDINEIIFMNRGNEHVFMLDGEEVTGALQNRIIATSTIAEANSTSRIPVVCAEEGRWDQIGGFRTGNYSYPKIRALLTKSRQKRTDTQKIIWREIQRKMTVTKTRSATSSMHDIFDNLSEEIDRYIEDFQSLNHGTVGIVGVAGNNILGCDIFQNPNIYQKLEEKLIRSYALDALEYREKGGNQQDVERFFKNTLIALSKKNPRRKIQHFTIKGDGLLGQSLVYDGNIIHVSAFPL